MNDALTNFAPIAATEAATLYRLIYRSEAIITAEHGTREELQRLAATSAQMNALNGVTGALLYRPGRFLQVLEGSRHQLELTFERICRDRRHRKLALLEFAAVDQRRFGQWAMALAAHDPLSGADVINLALDGIASEGRSEALLDAVLAAFDGPAATWTQNCGSAPKRDPNYSAQALRFVRESHSPLGPYRRRSAHRTTGDY